MDTHRHSADAVAECPVRTPVYLDAQATTPCDPRVVEAMQPYFAAVFGNPHSTHAFGRAAREAVEAARAEVALLIGAEPREIIFTSGATESNNLAIKGAMSFLAPHRRHVVTAVTEHKCVLESVAALARAGATATILPVQPNGLLAADALRSALTPSTALVSIMAVNNEIGVIQPLATLASLAHGAGALFHSDAAQAAGKIPLDVGAMGIDLMSLSAHKLYGPKGIGALYVRRRPRVRLHPLIDGGGQERGLRSGTLATPLVVGFGEACRLARVEMAAEAERLAGLRDRLLGRLRAAFPDLILNGDADQRIPGNLNIAFPGIEAEALLARLADVALSAGSACTAAAIEPSYVLRALGLSEAIARASVRIGLGRFTTADEVDYAAARLIAEVGRLRSEA
jgi:cysteine desulfurase